MYSRMVNETPPTTVDLQQYTRMAEIARLMRRVKSGGGTFYWIAALSVINSLIVIFGGGVTFVIGLGITQFIDAIAMLLVQEIGRDSALIIQGVGLLLDLALAGLFALFGVFATKGKKWAFIAGMILYFLDGLLFLLVMDIWSIGFHLFMLWGLFTGLSALNKLNAMSRPEDQFGFPKNIGS